MADFRRYQPRRSSASPRGWGRFLVGAVAVVLIIIVWQAMARSGNKSTTNTNTNDNAITLINDNTNAANVNTTGQANTNQASNDNTNSDSGATPPDSSTVSIASCPAALSQFGTKKQVALTYNLAAANEQATAVINALKTAKVPGSFFVSGTFAEKNDTFVSGIAAAGFGVYNRSYDNPHFPTLTADQITTQLAKAETTISALTEHTTKPFFRPPYGDLNDTVVKTVHDDGYCTILWTVDAYDWSTDATVATSASRVMAKLRAGAIIMLSAGYDITAELTKKLATDIAHAGYQLVDLPTLFSSQ